MLQSGWQVSISVPAGYLSYLWELLMVLAESGVITRGRSPPAGGEYPAE